MGTITINQLFNLLTDGKRTTLKVKVEVCRFGEYGHFIMYQIIRS